MSEHKAAEASSGMDATKSRSAYASPLIKERRQRILTETRKIISEQGLASVTVEEVANRAGVAKRTIYNAFQSKERLIATAIQQYFDEYALRLTYVSAEDTVDRIIERMATIARRNFKIRNYTRALMNIYYSHEIDPEIQQAIYNIAAETHESWVHSLNDRQLLQPWVDADELVMSLVAYRYSLAFAWAEGRIADDAFVAMLLRGFLTLMAGATCGSARAEIEDRLKTLNQNPFIIGEKILPDTSAL